MIDFRQRWTSDWARLGLAGDDTWLARLLAGYAEPGRHYHTLQHLGAAPARFAQYEQQVRAEYAAVPASLYRQKRRELLARFLSRPAIYGTPELHARLEAQARSNLGRVIGNSPAQG